jgi:hypothetical protein
MTTDYVYVVAEEATGWSTEAMRFATREAAEEFIAENPETTYTRRKEPLA